MRRKRRADSRYGSYLSGQEQLILPVLFRRSSDSSERQVYNTLRLRDAEFRYICRRAYDYCGLDIRSGKEELVQGRLTKLMRQLNIQSFREYCSYLERDMDGQALSSMVDCLTTNHTGFFREEQHFKFLISA